MEALACAFRVGESACGSRGSPPTRVRCVCQLTQGLVYSLETNISKKRVLVAQAVSWRIPCVSPGTHEALCWRVPSDEAIQGRLSLNGEESSLSLQRTLQ